MDFCDTASSYEEAFLNASIKNHQIAAAEAEANSHVGYCLYCGEKLDHPGKFCSIECRDDYEYEQRVKQMQGRK